MLEYLTYYSNYEKILSFLEKVNPIFKCLFFQNITKLSYIEFSRILRLKESDLPKWFVKQYFEQDDSFTYKKLYNLYVLKYLGIKDPNVLKDFIQCEKNLYLQKKIDGFNFKTPKNSIELIKLAIVMNNCVAEYNDDIIKKNSIIVYATDDSSIINFIQKNEGDVDNITRSVKQNLAKKLLCIELYPSTKIVKQCFTPFNGIPSEIMLDIANHYFDSIGYKKIERKHFYYDDDLPF